jgi:uncharacterized membrane protein required for colicin V production/uncharacterized protein YkwD
MIDIVLGVGLAALLIRGWLRGLVREAIGLGAIVAGTFMAFRLAGPMGAIVSAMTGAGEDAARIAGGIIVFLLVSVGGAVVSWVMHKGVRALPGLTTVNRLGGAAFSGLAGVLATTLVVSVLTLLPLPSGPAGVLEDSSLIGSMTDADSWPQTVLGFVSFDHVMTEALELHSVAGAHRIVAPARGRIAIEPVPKDDLAIRAKVATRLADMVNRSRVDLGVDPMARSAILDEMALRHALALYEAGRLSHNSGDGRIGARLTDAGIPVVVSGEAVALAPSARSAHELILDDSSGQADIAKAAYRRVGTAAVRGPLGLLVVVVFAG